MKAGDCLMSRQSLFELFTRFLKDNGIVGNLDDFVEREKVHYLFFIADKLGLGSGYNYDFFLRGPASSEIFEDMDNPIFSAPGILFRCDDFLKVVSGKDIKWLRVASTILRVYELGLSKGINFDDVVEIVYELLGGDELRKIDSGLLEPIGGDGLFVDRDFIRNVLDELSELGILSVIGIIHTARKSVGQVVVDNR